MKKCCLFLFSLYGLCLLAACGGGGPSSAPPPPASQATSAAHFSVTAPAAATAGTAVSFTVTALDASNNIATGYSGTAHFSSTDGQAVLPANSPLTNGVGSFSATLKTDGGQTITATDTIAVSITGTSSSINVTGVTGAIHFSLTTPANAISGTAFNYTVTALDGSNDTATGYSGTVHFSSTDELASLPQDSTLRNGMGTFLATLHTIGSETITAADTVTASINGTSSSVQVVASPFHATGSMGSPRVSHTATLLNDEQVLITGGTDGTVGLSSAELFNPTSGSFAPTGSMSTARLSHTATLLQNGKVLIAGGINEAPLSTAELFDPSSGTFTATGSMETARQGHTATLLNNGKVLVTGGLAADALATAELFDPSTGTFTATGSMETTRYYHTATLLSDGKVLIAGGAEGGGDNGGLVTAELYDPSTGTFTATGDMETVQVFDAVTLLNNSNVLFAGGFGTSRPPVPTAELYDPSSETFTATGNLTTARARHTATLLQDGTVLVAGGVKLVVVIGVCSTRCTQQELLATSSTELFDPISGTFVATGDMTTARETQTATLLNNGVVLITGGRDVNGNALATAELYQ